MAAFAEMVTILCLAALMTFVDVNAEVRPVYRLPYRHGYKTRELVMGGEPQRLYSHKESQDRCSEVHGRMPNKNDLLASEAVGFANFIRKFPGKWGVRSIFSRKSFSIPVSEWDCHSYTSKIISHRVWYIYKNSSSVQCMIEAYVRPDNTAFYVNADESVCIRDVPDGIHLLRYAGIENLTYDRRSEAQSACRSIGGDLIDSHMIYHKDVNSFLSDLQYIPEWRPFRLSTLRFATKTCRGPDCLIYDYSDQRTPNLKLEFKLKDYRVFPLCHSKITGPTDGDKKCVFGDGTNSEFYFKPKPTQYATTWKEAMYVCSKLGADIPQYFSKKCLGDLAGSKTFIFTRALTPGQVYYAEWALRVKKKKAPIYCQRPVERCLNYGTLFMPPDFNFTLKTDLATAVKLCQGGTGVLPSASTGFNTCSGKFLLRMQHHFRMSSLPKVWTQSDTPHSENKNVICFQPYSKWSNMDISQIPQMNFIGLDESGIYANTPQARPDKTCSSGIRGDNFVFTFEPTYARLATNFATALSVCTKLGGDVPQYVHNSCHIGMVFSRDLSHNKTLQYQEDLRDNGQALRVVCQRPLQRCQHYGTLFMPKDHKANAEVNLQDARRLCTNSEGTVPWQTTGAVACANQLRRRLKFIYKLASQPDVWWEDTANDPSAKKLAVCFLPYSNEVSGTVPAIQH